MISRWLGKKVVLQADTEALSKVNSKHKILAENSKWVSLCLVE